MGKVFCNEKIQRLVYAEWTEDGDKHNGNNRHGKDNHRLSWNGKY